MKTGNEALMTPTTIIEKRKQTITPSPATPLPRKRTARTLSSNDSNKILKKILQKILQKGRKLEKE